MCFLIQIITTNLGATQATVDIILQIEVIQIIKVMDMGWDSSSMGRHSREVNTSLASQDSLHKANLNSQNPMDKVSQEASMVKINQANITCKASNTAKLLRQVSNTVKFLRQASNTVKLLRQVSLYSPTRPTILTTSITLGITQTNDCCMVS